MLHSRLRPLPRTRDAVSSPSAPAPEFDNEDEFNEPPEDLFTAFLPHLFPDDVPSFHGDPGQHLLYSSPYFGDLEIMVPSYPSQSESRTQEIAAELPRANGEVNEVNEVEEGRKLFAHVLWSAAMVVAEGVEKAASCSPEDSNEDTEMWRVAGENVLELGAGAALPSIVCALANASSITITDHPSSPALSGAIAFNVARNLRSRAAATPAPTEDITIRPHEWGFLDSDPWAVKNKGAFTCIIAADCCWMQSQHENLARTLRWFLAPEGKVWVVAGFHTGRAIVAGFFEEVLAMGLEIERIYERDLNSSESEGGEVRRDWVAVRDGEGPENRKRWAVVALLRHARLS